MSKQPEREDYITEVHSVQSSGQSSNQNPITSQDFRRLVDAIEHENIKQKATVLVSLFPFIEKKYQNYRAVGEILGISRAAIESWIRIGSKYKFIPTKYRKGGESKNVSN